MKQAMEKLFLPSLAGSETLEATADKAKD